MEMKKSEKKELSFKTNAKEEELPIEVLDKVHEECGVIGIWDSVRKDVAKSLYYGLLALQHRGQEAAGAAVTDTDGPRGNLCFHKELGLVTEVFRETTLKQLKGNMGIGHVRYSTTGGNTLTNAQPITGYYQKGILCLAHNGNLVNGNSLREKLMQEGHTFGATVDTEVIHRLIIHYRSKTSSIEEAVSRTMDDLAGGFALVVMSPRKLVAVRDSFGLKPLVLGQTKTGWVVASETCAFDVLDAEYVRDIEPGEILTISKEGLMSDRRHCKGHRAHCVFEYIYFARLDSKLDGISIYQSRYEGGRALARAYPVDADLVAGVPESGNTAAAGYAMESGIPYQQVFYKNGYIGRTFIKPTQEEREEAVHMKLNVIENVVRGKRIILIDDSIVRGTTMAKLVRMLRRAGAISVHVRVCSPPFLYPCYYGTDVPDTSQLIARHVSETKICEEIGADSLGYMKLEDLNRIVGDLPVCCACFDGKYPTE